MTHERRLKSVIAKLPESMRKPASAALRAAVKAGWAEWVRGESDLRAMLDPDLQCYFDAATAERAKGFFQDVLRIKDPNDPSKWVPFSLLDWQYRDVIAPMFGWMRKDGRRRFRKASVWIPKKNGKSILAAGCVLYLLVADREPEAEIYSAASTVRQAAIVFGEAAKMVRKSPALSRVLQIRDHVKRIEYRARESFYQVLSKDADAADGINIHGLVFDELHRQKNRELYEVLEFGGVARRQPLQITISTAGDDFESIGYEQFEIAEKVLSGAIIDHEFFAYVAAAGEDDDPKDPATWRKANPSLGQTLTEESMAKDCQRAHETPAKLRNFLRLRLNRWVGRQSGWLPIEQWRACARDIRLEGFAGMKCRAGLDLASKLDLNALVLTFPVEDRRIMFPFFWMPEDNLAVRQKQDGVPYGTWADQGLIRLTPGDYVDLETILDDMIGEILPRFAVEEVAIDPAFGGDSAAIRLKDAGYETFVFRQSFRMMDPVMRRIEALVASQDLEHADHPTLNWHASNVAIETNSEELIRPVKPKGRKRIDGIVAAAMSLGKDVAGGDFRSVYEDDADAPARPRGKSVYEAYDLILPDGATP